MWFTFSSGGDWGRMFRICNILTKIISFSSTQSKMGPGHLNVALVYLFFNFFLAYIAFLVVKLFVIVFKVFHNKLNLLIQLLKIAPYYRTVLHRIASLLLSQTFLLFQLHYLISFNDIVCMIIFFSRWF